MTRNAFYSSKKKMIFVKIFGHFFLMGKKALPRKLEKL